MRRDVRGLVIGATLALLSCVWLGACRFSGITGPSGGWKRGTSAHSLVAGGILRSFLVHVPAKQPVNTATGLVRPYPLLIVLHGSSGSAEDMRQTTRMDSLSEINRFLVAYPEGVKGGGGLFPSDWNAGTCCGAAGREQIDDVGFIAALVANVGKNLALDKRRVYVAGFSDGGRMAHRLACKLSGTVAAIAVVSGSLKDDTCAPAVPVPVLAIHGTTDDQVAYDDPALTPPPAPVAGLAATLPPSVQFWIATNRCTGALQTRTATDVLRTSFSSCTSGDVVFYAIEGGSHAWPGDPGGSGSRPPMSELAASAVIAQFVTRQTHR